MYFKASIKFTWVSSRVHKQYYSRNSIVDPAFSIARMRFPLDGETRFFIIWKIDFYWLRKMTWSRHLFLFYF